MTKITIKPDFLTSVLVTYHIMCAPTSLTRRFNGHLYERFENEISPEERGRYVSFLIENVCSVDQMYDMRNGIFFPDYRDCQSFLKSGIPNSGKTIPIPKAIGYSVLNFQERFRQYWEKAEEEIEGLIPKHLDTLEENHGRIYEIVSNEIPSEIISKPQNIEMRVVDGLSPSSYARERYGIYYIVEQLERFRENDAMLNTFVHELIPHRLAKPYRDLQKSVFGRYVYEFEEGFAKLLAHKVTKIILPCARSFLPHPMSLEGAFYLFEDRWPLLRQMSFFQWYEMCLKEIREKLTFEPKKSS
jgi:hypothetical protein